MEKLLNSHNFVLLIQGPLHYRLLESIPNYIQYSDVVISTCTPVTDIENQLLDKIKELTSLPLANKLSVVYQPNIEYMWFNGQNIYKQTISTLYGLQLCHKEFTIKLRTDEFFENLNPFIAALNKDKIICSDFFYNGLYPMHISDHIIGMLTSDMVRVFNIVKLLCECVPKNLNHEDRVDGMFFGLDFTPVVESIIFSAYIKTKQLIPHKVHSETYRKLYSESIPSSRLGRYIAIANCENKKYTNEYPNGTPLS